MLTSPATRTIFFAAETTQRVIRSYSQTRGINLAGYTMRIAVIGSGISGNLAARLLAGQHDVHVFEAGGYAGGHTNTVDFQAFGRRYSADTGFMVFNERTYPNFCRLLELLGVDAQDSDMSFSVRCQRSGLEYQGSSLNGLFAQRRNLLRPSFHRMLADIVRFNREAPNVLARQEAATETLGEYLAREKYSRQFVEQYLVPMTAAIWSARPRQLLEFPVHFLVAFFRNHGLLQLRDRPQWKTIVGGARTYVEALLAPLRDRIRLNCPVRSVTRHADHVLVRTAHGADVFDEVVIAAHADQALRMLTDADDIERQILLAFPYQKNEAVLHTDVSMLPRRRRARASWNYHIPPEADCPAAVTYDLSRLQGLDSPRPILLTLNDVSQIDPSAIIQQITYHHPAYSVASIAAQKRHALVSGRRRTHFCGAYWGYGFHEDGVNSALSVAKHFGIGLSSCTAASTGDASSIDATAL